MMTRVHTLNTIHEINVEDVEMHLIKRVRNAQQLIQSVMAATIVDISNTCYSTKTKYVRTLDDNDNYDENVFLGMLVTENYENENSKSESIFPAK